MEGLINPADSVERQRDKLLNICAALIKRVEQPKVDQSSAFAQFERAALLDSKVRQRTMNLERALDLLNESNAELAAAKRDAEQSRSILNEAVESVDEGFALFDSQDRLLLFNSRFCLELGSVRDRLKLGISFDEYVDIVSTSSEIEFSTILKRDSWVTERLEHHRQVRAVFNIALKRNRWLQVSEHRTEEGGTAILQTDISDVMRQQLRERDELVDSQDKMLRATLDHLAQGVCIFSQTARLAGWNRELERMIQIPARYVRPGTSFATILGFVKDNMTFAGSYPSEKLIAWANNSSGRPPIEFELTDIRKRVFSVFAQEMPDQGFMMSFSDVTSERIAANKLRELNKTLEERVADRTKALGAALQDAERANVTKNRFVAAASHDLLQPLSAAKLYLATLQDAAPNDQMAQISGKAERALKGAEDIIEALLDISKLDAGHATFDVRPFALGPVLSSLLNEMTPIAEEKGLDLAIGMSDAAIVSDPVFLRRVLQNLISNAIKYTDHGAVNLRICDTAQDAMTLEIQDTGPGIAPEDRERIFQEFTRLEDSHSGAKGIGLGLAIVERVCTALDHPLQLQSDLGQGSCFSVTVPLHLGANPNIDQTGTVFFDNLAIVGKMLLLVENDEDLANAMSLRLERSGAHVVHAASGEEALELLEEIDLLPDAALFDYQLGAGIDGIDLHEIVRARYKPVPTFILSADRSAKLQDRCLSADVPLIHKPIDIDLLLEALDSVLGY
ncbi:MAG: PAS-domain containing protein [Rhodobacteraceae bacterium]|nr:PAS-domain containing protein [Paracoccaceae bacterium]